MKKGAFNRGTDKSTGALSQADRGGTLFSTRSGNIAGWIARPAPALFLQQVKHHVGGPTPISRRCAASSLRPNKGSQECLINQGLFREDLY